MSCQPIRIFATLCATAWLASAAPAFAAAQCGPSVLKDAITYKDGMVAIRPPWRGDWIYICNLNTPYGGVPTQTCWGWFSQLNVAIAEGRNIAIWYDTIDQSACATMTTYGSAPVPLYVHLQAP